MADGQTADVTTSGSLRPNGLLVSAIDTTLDEDWFRIQLIAGHRYQIDLLGAFGGVFTLPDPLILGVFDAAGTPLPDTFQDDVEPGVNLDSRLFFTPATGGTYFIAAGAVVGADEAASTGTYALAVTDLDLRDLRADPATTGRINVGGAGTQGRIDVPDDTDWLKVTLRAGHTYRIDLTGFDSKHGTLVDPVLLGVHFDGALLPFTGNDDRPGAFESRIELLARQDGTYFVDVGAFGGFTGTYRVTVRDVTPRDLAADTTTTGRLAVNGTVVQGRHESADDADWYKVKLVAGVDYVIEMTGLDTGQGTLRDPLILGLRDANGVARPDFGITANDDGGLGLNSLVRFTPTETGDYFVVAGDALGEVGTYRLSVRTNRAADLPANANTTAEAVIGGSILGTLDRAGDVDWIRAALLPGRTYQIDLVGQGGEGAALSDPFLLGLFRPGGELLEGTANDDFGTGRNSRVTFTSPGSELFIAAGGYADAKGNYRLTVTDITIADLTATVGTAGRIAMNNQTAGLIDKVGDEDWFRVSLTAGRVYAFEANSNPSSPSPLGDPLITGLYDRNGVAIPGTAVDDYGESLNARTVFVAPSGGTYFLGVAAFGDATGEYIASLRDITRVTDLEPSDASTTRRVAVGGAATGVINTARDEDWFGVELQAGVAYAFNLRGEASGNGTLLDPRIVGLYDAAGALIPGTPNDNAPGTTDSRLVFRATEDGLHFIGAAGALSDEGSYRVSVEVVDIGSDVAATPQTTAVVAVDGAPLAGTIDFLGDVDWVRVAVQAGVTYEVRLRGASSGDGTLADPQLLGIFDALGRAPRAQFLSPDADGKNDIVVVGAETGGDLFIALRSAEAGIGTYELEVDHQPGLDFVGPRLIAISPADGFAAADPFGNITLTFSEGVKRGTGAITLRATGEADLVIPITSPRLSFDGRIVTIDPLEPLAEGKTYTLTLDAGAVTDLAGNAHAGLAGDEAPEFTTTVPQDKWTLMIYIAGDNNLEGAAIDDLNEMESISGLIARGINVVVLTDRAVGQDGSSGNWTDTRFGLITPDSDTAVANSLASAATSQGEFNMGDPAALTTFINAAAALAPAQKYGLVIWDHGGGLGGAAADDASNDILSVKEIRSGIDAASIAKFDLIGFDACQMAIAEMAFEVRDLADVYVGSEMNEPGDGWAYDVILQALKTTPNMTEAQLASTIVTAYGAQYAGQADMTLSALSTQKLDEIGGALNTFAALAAVASPVDRAGISVASAVVQRFPDVTATAADLTHFMTLVKANVANAALDDAAQDVIDAVNDAVFATSGTVANAGGLAVNLPFFQDVQPDYNATNYLGFLSLVPLWPAFLELI